MDALFCNPLCTQASCITTKYYTADTGTFNCVKTFQYSKHYISGNICYREHHYEQMCKSRQPQVYHVTTQYKPLLQNHTHAKK